MSLPPACARDGSYEIPDVVADAISGPALERLCRPTPAKLS